MLRLTLFLGVVGCKQTDPEIKRASELVLFDFEDSATLEWIRPQNATFGISKKDGNAYLEVTNGFGTREPGVKLLASIEKPMNLEGYYQVKADVSNVGDEFIQVEMFVGNDPDGLKRWFCSDYVDLEPGEQKTITVPLAWTPWVFSPQPKIEGMRGAPGILKTDIGKIDEIVFCSRYAYTENTFTVDNVRATGVLEVRDTTGLFPFVDQFGQYRHKDWPGKMHDVAELKQKASADLEILENTPAPKDRSVYGGWLKGPKLKATGFFRTEKYRDKWWMVDPEGYLFWSAGVNCVASESVYTGITGREKYFSYIPEKEGVHNQFYAIGTSASHGFYKDKKDYDTYNYYQDNLYKKYGNKWRETFRDLAHKRFKSWGLNTIGFVSDFGATAQQKTPYTGSIWIKGTPKIEGSDGFWGKFHDVFDPNFRKAVRRSMESQKDGAGDPWCIGFFIDNELSWGALGSLAIGTLRSPVEQPAKMEFVKDLKLKYSEIEALNQKWKTSYGSWEQLLASTEAPEKENAIEDLISFYEKIALTYFKTLSEELDQIAPGQNYLGCRFAWQNNATVLKAASKYLDIMSFNKYEYSVAGVSLPAGLDAPILISEFHFGSTDSGLFHPGVKLAKDQRHRGTLYGNYVKGALRNPNIVGTHWFQYLDEPLTGRFDGENYNVGLVDGYDNPHEELVEKIRETHYSMYAYRLEN